MSKQDMKLDTLLELFSFVRCVFAFVLQHVTGIVICSVGVSSVSCICCFLLNVRLSVQLNRSNFNQHEMWMCSAVMFCLWKK